MTTSSILQPTLLHVVPKFEMMLWVKHKISPELLIQDATDTVLAERKKTLRIAVLMSSHTVRDFLINQICWLIRREDDASRMTGSAPSALLAVKKQKKRKRGYMIRVLSFSDVVWGTSIGTFVNGIDSMRTCFAFCVHPSSHHRAHCAEIVAAVDRGDTIETIKSKITKSTQIRATSHHIMNIRTGELMVHGALIDHVSLDEESPTLVVVPGEIVTAWRLLQTSMAAESMYNFGLDTPLFPDAIIMNFFAPCATLMTKRFPSKDSLECKRLCDKVLKCVKSDGVAWNVLQELILGLIGVRWIITFCDCDC